MGQKNRIKNIGIIEGFYGKPWTHENRLDVIDFLRNNNLNTYVYAPKNDPYHRDLWKEPYSLEEADKLQEIIKKANDYLINFVYCISPGKNIDLTDENDIQLVSKKLLAINQNNISSFALLMDDIDYFLNETEKNRFLSPGIAHAYLANKVYDSLKTQIKNLEFFICPTEYWQNWNTTYRQDLYAYLNENITVFFTGYNTIAKTISSEDIIDAFQIFGHRLAIWDNYPTNDANKDRIYLGPLLNRPHILDKEIINTYVMNPMNQWELSKIALITAADYLSNPLDYQPEKSLEKAISYLSKEWHVSKESLDLFVRLNQSTRLKESILKDFIEDIDKSSNLKIWLEKLRKSHQELNSVNSNLLEEIEPWLDKMFKEIKYLEAFIENQYIIDYKDNYNLGFNFGSYAQRKIGGNYE
jgi:hyaluronoglucosaminidase